MKVIITENQYSKLLLESNREKISKKFAQLKDFGDSVISSTKQDVKVNFRMLATWGAAVGGIIEPLNGFIQNGNFTLTPFQVTCILVATSSILFGESKRTIDRLLSIIKKENVEKEFSEILSKGNELKNAFLDFMESLNLTMYTVTNIMSYAFIIPILPILWEMSHNGVKSKEITELVMRLTSFGVVSISGNLLKQLFKKLIDRFRG